MKKIIKLFLTFTLALNYANAQGIGINETGNAPDPSAILDVSSTDKGFLPPRMTTTERDAINGGVFEEGLTIFNTDDNCLQWWNGKGWYDGCDKGLTAGPESACPLIPPYLSASETVVKNVSNPVTGKTWMDRNLGAYGPARSSTDCWAYGNLYQWGRAGEGHEYRSSDTHDGGTLGLASTSAPNTGAAWYGHFIISATSPFDWLHTQHNNLWQGVNGANNPCPTGYRVPTEAELNAERTSWSTNTSAGAFASPLKLPTAGYRSRATGALVNVGSEGVFWSSSDSGTNARRLFFGSSAGNMDSLNRALGFSVRCIKD